MRPAGDRLRAVAARILDQRSIERIIEPLLADLEMECAEAVQCGRVWKSRWILILGYSAFLKTIALWQVEEIMSGSWSRVIDDREALIRALKFSVAAGAMATLVFAAPPIVNARLGLSHPGMFVYLVPQAIVLAVPIGFTFGVFLGLRARSLSVRSTATVLACAIVCSFACLATLAWIVPPANQEFRQAIFGRTQGGMLVMKSFNELTLGELSERLRSFQRTGLIDWNPLLLAYTYHLRWALSCATLVLALFALAMTRVMVTRWAVTLAALGTLASYYALLSAGRTGALRETLPAVVGAWLPNMVFGLVWLALTASPRADRMLRPDGPLESEDK